MNALTDTFRDLTKTLAKATAPVPCVGDVVQWCQAQPRNPYSTFGFAMRLHIGATAFMPLSEAKAKLAKARAMHEAKRASKHWSYDPNSLIALRQMQALIERFEKETA